MTIPNNQVSVQGQGALDADAINTFIQLVPNVAALRNFVGQAPMTVFLQGTNTVGDGGQAFYVWNATSPGPNNPPSLVVPNGVTQGGWVRDPIGILQADDISFEFLGGAPPVSNEVMGQETFVRPMTFLANFGSNTTGVAAAKGYCQTNPTATFTITVYNNATIVGTIVIGTTGGFTFATTGGLPFSVVAGDTMTFSAQSSTDATLANVSWTISGALA